MLRMGMFDAARPSARSQKVRPATGSARPLRSEGVEEPRDTVIALLRLAAHGVCRYELTRRRSDDRPLQFGSRESPQRYKVQLQYQLAPLATFL
jgi:hypothetical protein